MYGAPQPRVFHVSILKRLFALFCLFLSFRQCCAARRTCIVRLSFWVRFRFAFRLCCCFICLICVRVAPCAVARATLSARCVSSSLLSVVFFFFLVSRTRHHSCAGHCSTIRSLCNFIQNATIPPGRNTKNQQRNTNHTQTENQAPEWKQSSQFLYNVQLK